MRGGYCERAGVNRTAGRFFVKSDSSGHLQKKPWGNSV